MWVMAIGGVVRNRKLALAVTLSAVVLTAGACGGGSSSDGEELAAGGPTTTATTPDDSGDPSDDTAVDDTTTTTVEESQFPCDLVSQEKIDEIAGNPLDTGAVFTNHVTEDTESWTAMECSWTTMALDESTEVILDVSLADDFPSGSVECPPIPGSSEPVDGLGTSAQWSWVDAGTTVTVGDLRVCSDDALVQVKVSGAIGGEALLAVARSTAEEALAGLS